MKTTNEIALEFITLRDRKSHPDGKFDNGGRWYPDETERASCCNSVRSPSRSFPYSYLVHCRTIIHLAAKYGVDAKDIRREVTRIEREELGNPTYGKREIMSDGYKAVALVDGKMMSIYDGKTEYILGLEMVEQAHQNHTGGFYIYKTIADAKNADVPDRSILNDAPRVIIKCAVHGNYCRYNNDKMSFSHLTPLEVVE